MLDFDVIDGWDDELEQMNEAKVGEPYHYPDSFVHLLGTCEPTSTCRTDRRKAWWSGHMLERRYHPYQTTALSAGE
jgi:hypothetical protein